MARTRQTRRLAAQSVSRVPIPEPIPSKEQTKAHSGLRELKNPSVNNPCVLDYVLLNKLIEWIPPQQVAIGWAGLGGCDREIFHDYKYNEGRGEQEQFVDESRHYTKDKWDQFKKALTNATDGIEYVCTSHEKVPEIARGTRVSYRSLQGHRIEIWNDNWNTDMSSDDDFQVSIETPCGIVFCIGLQCCHPFILTNDISWINSDGSTCTNVDKVFKLTVDGAGIVSSALSLGEDYLFDQIH